jgi:hypothetical protein
VRGSIGGMDDLGTDRDDLTWVKSSLSFSNGNCLEVAWHKAAASFQEANCVEAGEGACGMIHVRDSKDPNGVQLRFTLAEWRAFTGGIVKGDFDKLIDA